MSNPAKEILVIGLGLIGSSLAKAAKNKGLIVHGFDEDKNSLEEALNKNIIDATVNEQAPKPTEQLQNMHTNLHQTNARLCKTSS